jgi:RNA polymerase sporulation-specific sigma factor
VNEITILDVLGTDSDDALNEVDKKSWKPSFELIKRLKMRERTVLAMRFGLPMGHRKTQKEIVHSLGIFRSYVSRIEKKVIAKELRHERQTL